MSTWFRFPKTTAREPASCGRHIFDGPSLFVAAMSTLPQVFWSPRGTVEGIPPASGDERARKDE